MDFNFRDMNNGAKSYALSGRIILSVIIILFFVVIMTVFLHLYARWYLLNAHRRQIRRTRNRRAHLVFYVDPSNPNAASPTAPCRGLDAAVLKSLPVFVYSANTHPDSIECAVCLSEFEENEMGRTLPKCNHSFHIECIDMWFHSHSTCPLCRSAVELVPDNTVREDSHAGSDDISNSSSGLCSSCQHEDASSSSLGGRRIPAELIGVTIEIPRRNNFVDESATESPVYRSPMTRMVSFRRILSRDRRGNLSPSSGIQASSWRGGSLAESDIERCDTQQTQRKIGSDSAM